MGQSPFGLHEAFERVLRMARRTVVTSADREAVNVVEDYYVNHVSEEVVDDPYSPELDPRDDQSKHLYEVHFQLRGSYHVEAENEEAARRDINQRVQRYLEEVEAALCTFIGNSRGDYVTDVVEVKQRQKEDVEVQS